MTAYTSLQASWQSGKPAARSLPQDDMSYLLGL
jgi:hypothetical protein